MPSGSNHIWKVETVEEFKFYCCPECDYKCKEHSSFQNHVIEKHSKSSINLFHENEIVKSEHENNNSDVENNPLPIDVTIHVKDEPYEPEIDEPEMDHFDEEICENDAVIKSERISYKRKSKLMLHSYNDDEDFDDSKEDIDKQSLKILEKKKKYSCNICAKEFVKKSEMILHKKHEHASNIKCEECNKKFEEFKDLAKKNNEKPYCETCDKKFSFATNYIRHVKKLHPDMWTCGENHENVQNTNESSIQGV